MGLSETRSGGAVDPVRMTIEQLKHLVDYALQIPEIAAHVRDRAALIPMVRARIVFPHENHRAAIANAQKLLALSEKRYVALPDGNFADPGWSLLLDLLVQESKGKPTTVSSACIGTGAPSTTALRYIAEYTDKGMIERHLVKDDQRKIHLTLAEPIKLALIDLLTDAF